MNRNQTAHERDLQRLKLHRERNDTLAGIIEARIRSVARRPRALTTEAAAKKHRLNEIAAAARRAALRKAGR